MSTQPKDQEPSMEEILSSIRRIIADEETDESKPDGDGDEATSGSTKGVEFDALDVIDDDDDDDDDGGDVLELTSVVEEGRDVVEPEADASSPASLEIVNDPIDDDDDDDDDIELAEVDDIPNIDDLTDTAAIEAENVVPEIELSPLAEEAPAPETPSMIEAISSQEDEPAVSTKKAESETLLSTGTASTTTGAFAKLSKAFRPTPVEESVADGAGRTVEQFIEDMARPMLKEWLDENMPAIVERLVQKEIQKIARRAELL